MLANIKAPKNGYAYIYVSNENDESVYFDNLQVAHNRGRIIEEDHYYALGLKIAGISSNKLGNDTYEGYLQNKNLYNDKELIDEADLDWYDYGFRNYDAQIGRFPQLDPLKDDYPELTPFQYASNDPIANIDIDGLEGGSSIGSFLTTANESSKFWLPQAAQLAKTTETVTKVGMSLSSVALRVGLVAANEGLRVGLDGQKSSDIEQRLHVNQVKEINRSWVPQGSNKSVNSITGQIRYSTTASESLYPEAFFALPNLKFGWALKFLGRGGEAVVEEGLSNSQLVQRAATFADKYVTIAKNPGALGTLKHEAATNLLKRYQKIYGYRGLDFKVRRASSILDVLDNRNGVIYDWKFGLQGGKTIQQLNNSSQMLRYQQMFGLKTEVIRP